MPRGLSGHVITKSGPEDLGSLEPQQHVVYTVLLSGRTLKSRPDPSMCEGMSSLLPTTIC